MISKIEYQPKPFYEPMILSEIGDPPSLETSGNLGAHGCNSQGN